MQKRIITIALLVLLGAIGLGYFISQNLSDPKMDNTQTSSNEVSRVSGGKSLDLSGQQLTSLPDSVTSQTDITSLNLSNNQLTTLPASIGYMTNLETLNIENNRLESLPPEIGLLKNLKNANFSNNRLTSLPAELGELTGLKILDLGGYKASMSDIDQLKSILNSTEIKS